MSSAGTNKFTVGVKIGAIDNATAPIRAITESISQATKGVRTFSSALVPDKAFNSFKLNMKGLGRATDEVFDNMSKSLKNFFWLFTGTGLLPGMFGGYAFGQMKEFSKFVIDLETHATGLGMKVNTIKGLNFAARSVGTDSESVSSILKNIADKRMAVRTRGLDADDPIYQLPGGVNFIDPKGNLKSTLQLFYEISDKISKIPLPERRAAALKNTFGDERALPFLESGGSWIQKKLLEAENYQLSNEYQKESARSAKDFQNSVAKIDAVLDSTKTRFQASFVPEITTGIDRITNKFNESGSSLDKIFKDLGKTARTELDSAFGWLKILGGALQFVSDKIGLVNILTISFSLGGLVLLGKTIQNVFVLGGQAVALMSKAFVFFRGFTVLGTILGAVGAINLGIIAIGASIFAVLGVAAYFIISKWDKIKEKFIGVMNGMRDFFSSTLKYFSEKIASILEVFGSLKELICGPTSVETVAVNGIIRTQKLEDLVRLNSSQNDSWKNPMEIPNSSRNVSEVVVKLENAPPGSRVTSVSGDVLTNVSLGYSLAGLY